MAAYLTLTTTRQTQADPIEVTNLLRSAIGGDTSAVIVQRFDGTWVGKKTTAWTQAQTTAAQTALDTAPAKSAELDAQHQIDAWPLSEKALVLALIDQLNTIRAALPTPLAAITPAQAQAAVRAKAGTL
jgi:hypothetical protein